MTNSDVDRLKSTDTNGAFSKRDIGPTHEAFSVCSSGSMFSAYNPVAAVGNGLNVDQCAQNCAQSLFGQRQILATTQANTEQRTPNTINGMAPATTVLTNGGALELRSQSSDLIPSLFRHQTGRRNNDGTNRAARKAVTAIRCGLVMSK